MILKLIHLEIKKYQLKTYFLAIGIISLVILGFLYTFALIAYAGGEVDAIEFSTYENIWTLINALQTVAYAVLISVMFSTFIIKEYAGKLNLLLFTYPVDKSTLLKAKVLLVAFIGIGGMLLGSALIFLIFFITERIFPLVPDTFSFGNIIKILADVRADIEATIDEAMNSADPEVQTNFKKYFGNKRPTPEEYIYIITKKTKAKL